MKGFPKHIATVEDFQNLLGEENFKEEAQIKLQELQDYDDRTVTRATNELINPDDPHSDFVVEEIENPYPLHRQKGFETWLDVVRLNADVKEVKVSELTEQYTESEIEDSVVVLT